MLELKHPRYSLIIPAHNEQDRIEKTLREYADAFHDSEIIVVLNGCSDRTFDIVRAMSAEFSHVRYSEINHAIGKGGAIRAGFLLARSQLVGFVDADGATPAGEMRRLFTRLSDADVVIGSRWISGARVLSKQSLLRRSASRVFNAITRVLLGLPFSDTQCGAKVFQSEALAAVLGDVETSNLAFDVDLLFALRRRGFRIWEEPTTWNDVVGSRVHVASAAFVMFFALLRLRLRHLPLLKYLLPYFDRVFPTKPIKSHDTGLAILILNWRDPSHPQAGGAEAYLFELARRWVRLGNRVVWLTSGYPGCRPEDAIDGVEIIRVGNALSVYFKLPWAYITRFRGRFEVILDAENGIPFFSPLYSLKPKLCLVFHVHKTVFQQHLPRYISWLFVWIETKAVPWIYRNCRFITISQTTCEEMEIERFSRFPIDVIYPGVSSQFVPGRVSATPVISYVGRLKAYKRVEMLLDAFAEVRRQVPGASLLIAGCGDQEKVLRKKIEDLGISNCVSLCGFVDEAEKIRILQQSWVFCTPSSMEGWGMVAIEANACGTPVVSFDVPGLREAIVDGFSGILVSSPDELVNALIHVLKNDTVRRALSTGAVERAKTFSWDGSAQQLLDLMFRESAGSSFSLLFSNALWHVVSGRATSWTESGIVRLQLLPSLEHDPQAMDSAESTQLTAAGVLVGPSRSNPQAAAAVN